jgi:tRNA A58 N-methylase Trm61
MTNIFEETYNTIAEAKKAYKAATTSEERDAAREKVHEAQDRIDEMGDIAHKIYRAYEKSRDNENEILDFDDIIWDRDVEALTSCMKENGIKAFTYSCRATDVIETLWLFKKAGCTIGEMVEVNLRENFFGKGYEKGHAFKMILN